jgi:hypothetical protein
LFEGANIGGQKLSFLTCTNVFISRRVRSM